MNKIIFLISMCLVSATAASNKFSNKSSYKRESMISKCTKTELFPDINCASTHSSVFTDDGRLWIAWSYGEHIYVSYSDDAMLTVSKPLAINSIPEKISSKGESRPKIASDNKGNIYVSWTTPLGKPYTGNIRFSYSHNNGDSFSHPITINDNLEIIGHRFDSLGIAKNGTIYLAWLDKRDNFKAKKNGSKEYTGSALYYAWSTDKGKSFQKNTKIIDHSCECCRLAIDIDEKDLPVLFWRNIYDKNTRDHALVNFKSPGKPGKPIRISFDNWKINACPHHGPDLSVSNSGDYHMVWFSGDEKNKGLFYMRLNPNKFSIDSMSFGDSKALASHPNVISHSNRVWIAWKEFDGKKELLKTMSSNDSGKTWNNEKLISETENSSDYPFLLKNNEHIYIQWKTDKEGFKLIKLERI